MSLEYRVFNPLFDLLIKVLNLLICIPNLIFRMSYFELQSRTSLSGFRIKKNSMFCIERTTYLYHANSLVFIRQISEYIYFICQKGWLQSVITDQIYLDLEDIVDIQKLMCLVSIAGTYRKPRIGSISSASNLLIEVGITSVLLDVNVMKFKILGMNEIISCNKSKGLKNLTKSIVFFQLTFKH